MITQGNFKHILDGKEVTEQEVRDCKGNMSVTVDGLSVFYTFLPKIKKEIHADWIDFIGSTIKRGKIIKYQNSAEKSLEKDDVITNTNRGKKEAIEFLNTEKVDKLTIQSFYEVVYTKPASNWNKLEITFSNKYLPKLDKVSVHSIMEDFKSSAEKDKTENLVFTTLEKELLSDNQQEHLLTGYKKPVIMYLDEFLLEQNYNNSQQKIIDDWNRDNTEFKVGDVYWRSGKLTGKLKEETFPQEEVKGAKTNKNKAQLSLLFKQFPKALEAIVRCSEYGHEKYKETDEDYLNYTRVYGGSKTYADASLRHRLEQGNDLESGLPHQFHSAWNAIAELELWIKENKTK